MNPQDSTYLHDSMQAQDIQNLRHTFQASLEEGMNANILTREEVQEVTNIVQALPDMVFATIVTTGYVTLRGIMDEDKENTDIVHVHIVKLS